MEANLKKSINACLLNAERLIDEAQLLEFEKPASSRFYFAIISQEESAKSFLLYLVKIKIIPWNTFLLRAINNHICKQLVGIIIDYLSPDFDSFIAWSMQLSLNNHIPSVPNKVFDAIEILRYEKIQKWESKNWTWVEDPEYDLEAKKVSKGHLDDLKQSALYVNINKNATIISTPNVITKEMAQEEFDRAKRFLSFGKEITKDGVKHFRDYEEIEEAFRKLFNVRPT
jgi:AbiV family abortive infection protein